MATKSVIGLKLVADAKDFVNPMQRAFRSLSSLEYLMGRASSKMKKGSAMRAAFTAMGFAGGTAMLGGMFSVFTGQAIAKNLLSPMLQAANETEVAMKRAFFLAGDASPDSALGKRIQAIVTKVATESTISIQEGYDTIGSIIQAGIDKSVAPDLLESVVRYSEASFGKATVADSVKLLTVGLQKFNVEGEDAKAKMERLGDILVAVKKHTAFDDRSLKSFFQALGAAPKLADTTSTEEFLTLGGMLMATGKTARRTGQNINSFTQTIVKTATALSDLDNVSMGKNIRTAAKEMGIEFTDLLTPEGKPKSILELMNITLQGSKKAAAKMGTDVAPIMESVFQKLFYGVKVAPELLKLISEMRVLTDQGELKGFEAFAFKLDAVKNSAGEMKRASDINRATWEGISKIIDGIRKSINTMVGQEIKNLLGNSLLMVKNSLTKIAAIIADSPNLRKFLASFILIVPIVLVATGAILSMFGAVVLGLGVMWPMLLELWAMATGAAGAAATFLGPMLLIMVPLILTAMALMGTFAYILSNNVGGSLDWVREKFNLIKLAIEGIVMFWKGWGETDMKKKLQKAGLWELIRSIWMLKMRFIAMWEGFKMAYNASGAGKILERLSKSIQLMFDVIFRGNGKFARDGLDTWAKFGADLFIIFEVALLGFGRVLDLIWLATIAVIYMSLAFKKVAQFIRENEEAFSVFATVVVAGLGLIALALTTILFIGGLLLTGFMGMLVITGLLVLMIVGPFVAGMILVYMIVTKIADAIKNIQQGIVDTLTELAKAPLGKALEMTQTHNYVKGTPGADAAGWDRRPAYVDPMFSREGPGLMSMMPTDESKPVDKSTKVGDIKVEILGNVDSPETAMSLAEQFQNKIMSTLEDSRMSSRDI